MCADIADVRLIRLAARQRYPEASFKKSYAFFPEIMVLRLSLAALQTVCVGGRLFLLCNSRAFGVIWTVEESRGCIYHCWIP